MRRKGEEEQWLVAVVAVVATLLAATGSRNQLVIAGLQRARIPSVLHNRYAWNTYQDPLLQQRDTYACAVARYPLRAIIM